MFDFVKRIFKGQPKEDNESSTFNEVYKWRLKYVALETILMAVLRDNEYSMSISKESLEYVRDNSSNIALEYAEMGEDETVISLVLLSEKNATK
jgi:hypothetical protein